MFLSSLDKKKKKLWLLSVDSPLQDYKVFQYELLLWPILSRKGSVFLIFPLLRSSRPLIPSHSLHHQTQEHKYSFGVFGTLLSETVVAPMLSLCVGNLILPLTDVIGHLHCKFP